VLPPKPDDVISGMRTGRGRGPAVSTANSGTGKEEGGIEDEGGGGGGGEGEEREEEEEEVVVEEEEVEEEGPVLLGEL